MCPAAFLFGSSVDYIPALGPVGPYLPQNDYSIIFIYYLRKAHRQKLLTACESCDHELPLKHRGGERKNDVRRL